MRLFVHTFALVAGAIICLCGAQSLATVINVGPSDTYAKIEGANPGDEVIIAPGTYAFRVYLTKQAGTTNPIYIHAQDPANPPVWDFGTNLVDNAPGSYKGGDTARGGWQLSGAQNYTISGIIFRHCRNAAKNCGAIRYYETTTNLCVKNCFFTSNDVGMTGGTQDSQATVEYCEFNANGNTNAPSSAPTHNIYIYGGYLTMRYCFIHDSIQGQNFHLRCRAATLEYNWFARANNYEGDLMSDDDFTGPGPYTQTLIFRGNGLVQNSSPGNHSQVLVLFNDSSVSNLTMSVQVLYNTFVGTYGSSQFVHLSNADGTSMNAQISDTIISGTTVPYYIESAAAGSASGVNNWMPLNAAPGALSNSIQSASPGFRNPAMEDYHLAPGSACIGGANASVYGLPGKEYYYNEATNLMWRPRAAARDLGAFESTSTNNPVGPYDAPLQPTLNINLPPHSTNALLSWPLFAQDFQLAQSLFFPTPVWSAAPVIYTTNASNVTATVPVNASSEFFCLQKF
ncbi:MAG TPA: hypothetical protein VFC44_25430 [Candidatus Saccharimonadales bacterium]|nr:hypothetical protein [Candidatus Saccharimonadales bacterium]